MEKLLNVLKEKNLTLGSIESMTGGLFASKFTSIPGASKVFKGAVVTYATEEKINVVGIDANTINKYSVVSKEVAIEMAEKGKKLLNVDICVSVTGNAGPSCEPGGKPVGEIHIALSNKNETIHRQLSLKGDRNHIQCMCVDEMTKLILFSLK